MATQNQIDELRLKLKKYKSKYLRKEFSHLNESDTRIMTNGFLTEVLGYEQLVEVKTEFRIRGEYADYVIQVGRKKHFVVEVKSIQIDLDKKHLRQSLNYAANEGIDWILLTNGRQIEVFKVNFGKPIASKLVFSLDLLDKDDFKSASELLVYITRKCVLKDELEDFWKRISALSPLAIAKMLYSEDIARTIRNSIKRDTGIYFQLDDVGESIYKVVTQSIDIGNPRFKKL
jgi:hypothetical protein